MSKRSKIVNALVSKLKEIDGNAPFISNIFNNVENKLVFYDEVNDFPYLYVTAGPEQREYLPAGFKWAFLSVTIRVYVNAENPHEALEAIFEDIEYIVDTNGNLDYDNGNTTEDIQILSINTDEGLLAPIGVGEIDLLIRYDLDSSG